MEDLSSAAANLRLLDGVLANGVELYLLCLPEPFDEVELADEAEDGGVRVGWRVVYSNCCGLLLSRLAFAFGMCGSCLTDAGAVVGVGVSLVSSNGFCSGW